MVGGINYIIFGMIEILSVFYVLYVDKFGKLIFVEIVDIVEDFFEVVWGFFFLLVGAIIFYVGMILLNEDWLWCDGVVY